MKLTRKELAAAPLCGNCYDYIDEPDCKIVERKRGWIHVGNNSRRCGGQEDDDTDDRVYPLRRYGRTTGPGGLTITSMAMEQQNPGIDESGGE